MSDKPPPEFDAVRAAFYLVAFVIGVESVFALMSAAACFIHAELIISNPDIKCDPDNKIFQMMAGALAAAIAFASIRKSRDKDDGK